MPPTGSPIEILPNQQTRVKNLQFQPLLHNPTNELMTWGIVSSYKRVAGKRLHMLVPTWAYVSSYTVRTRYLC